jgi:hypothetical protein
MLLFIKESPWELMMLQRVPNNLSDSSEALGSFMLGFHLLTGMKVRW